jgi:hypothetical protein
MGLPHRKLIDPYLLDCVKSRMKPNLKWIT